jgi:hypothetical protein
MLAAMTDTHDVERLSPLLPVDDLAAAVEAWSALLGVEPTFVDGERYAQFDVAGSRLALAGTDRAADVPAVMVKVGDLAAARERALASGLEAGDPQEGPHEVRCVVTGPGGWPVVLYAPRAR